MIPVLVYALLLTMSFWGNCRDKGYAAQVYWGVLIIGNTALLINQLNDLGVFK